MTQAHHLATQRIETPLGPLLAARSRRGLSGLWFDGQRHHPGLADLPSAEPGDEVMLATRQALQAYFEGRAWALPPLDLAGTPFQQRVWQQIAAIAPGKTVSYGDIAHALQTSPRPVGTACGANPLPLVVPCHRVVGKTGLGGFNGQKTNLTLDVKRWLLRHEGHRI